MSELRVTTISDTAGTGAVTLTKQHAAKAWVNFNGQGTIAARDSFNVTSLTDNGTGDYTNSFTNAMSSGDYIEVDGSIYFGTTRGTVIKGDNHSSLSTSFRVQHVLTDNSSDGTSINDPDFVKRGFLGDLA